MKRGLDGSPDMIRTRAYSNGILEESDFQVTHVSEHSPATAWSYGFCEPSADDYDTHKFLVCHAVRLDADGGLGVAEIDAFVNDRWLGFPA